MSFLAVVHSAAAGTPLPSPFVVEKTLQPIIQQGPEVPAQLLALGQVLGLAAVTAFVSLVHQLVEKGRLSGNVNRLIVAGYTLVAALGTAALTGHLGTSIADLQIEITSFLVALGAALGRYEFLWKFVLGVLKGVLPTPAADPTISGSTVTTTLNGTSNISTASGETEINVVG